MPHLKRQRTHITGTVVLQPRRISTRPLQLNVVKQGFSGYARGSPPTQTNVRVRLPTLLPLKSARHVHRQQPLQTLGIKPQEGLVGIDNIVFRVIARVLVCIMLSQPVYVAMGMDISEGSEPVIETGTEVPMTSAEDVAEDTVEEVAPVEEVALSNEGGDESEEYGEESGEPLDADTEDVLPREYVEDMSNDGTDNAVIEEDGDDVASSEQVEEGVEVIPVEEVVVPTEETVLLDGVSDGTSPDVQEQGEDPDESLKANTEGVSPVENGGGVSASNEGDIVLEEGDDISTTTNDVSEESEETLALAIGALEEDVTTPVEEVDSSVPDDAYMFGKADCTIVADGEYYCISPTTPRYVEGEPRVYAEKDREGDREILYFDGTEVKRITNNSYDDFAPAYDAETKRIVWQAHIADRMRIMVHDLVKHETREITGGQQNASNPSILGDTVVWQEWVDTNWEVMMTDVGNDGASFEIERLTDNAVHDMFPRAYNGLVTWQSERDTAWEVVVYNLHTGMRHNLEKQDTTNKYENPRFVLLFDSKHDNGDVETIGYDLDTGEMMELGTRANPQPHAPITPKQEIPDVPVQTASTSMQKVKTDADEDDTDIALPFEDEDVFASSTTDTFGDGGVFASSSVEKFEEPYVEDGAEEAVLEPAPSFENTYVVELKRL